MTDEQRLVSCFHLVFADLSEADIVAADMRTLGRWNSFALLTLIARIETEFNLRLSADHLNAFTSFASILDVVQRLRRAENGEPVSDREH